MNESLLEGEEKTDIVKKMEGLFGGTIEPEDDEKWQMVLMYHHFCSQKGNENITPVEFASSNSLQFQAGSLWKKDGLSATYREMLSDPLYKDNFTAIDLEKVLERNSQKQEAVLN